MDYQNAGRQHTEGHRRNVFVAFADASPSMQRLQTPHGIQHRIEYAALVSGIGLVIGARMRYSRLSLVHDLPTRHQQKPSTGQHSLLGGSACCQSCKSSIHRDSHAQPIPAKAADPSVCGQGPAIIPQWTPGDGCVEEAARSWHKAAGAVHGGWC